MSFKILVNKLVLTAEVKEVARSNAEAIINGDSVRKIRTDDLPKTTNLLGGSVNNCYYGTVQVDKMVILLRGSGSTNEILGSSQNDPEGLENAKRAFKII